MPFPQEEPCPLRQLTRGSDGFFQPDCVGDWLDPVGGRCAWEHLSAPEPAMDVEFAILPNHGEGDDYGVTIDYVGAHFFAAPAIDPEPLGPLCGRMIGAVLAPHHGRVPSAANLYFACDSIDEDITQVARVLLDHHPVETLFGGGSLFVVVEAEFVPDWNASRQEQALRLVVNRLAERRKRLRRVAVQVQVPSFSREARPEDPPELQLRYRDALASEWARWQQIQLSPARRVGGELRQEVDLRFSVDRRFSHDESIVELLRQSGQLPPRPSAF